MLLQNAKKKDKGSMPIIQKQLNVYIHLCDINFILFNMHAQFHLKLQFKKYQKHQAYPPIK